METGSSSKPPKKQDGQYQDPVEDLYDAFQAAKKKQMEKNLGPSGFEPPQPEPLFHFGESKRLIISIAAVVVVGFSAWRLTLSLKRPPETSSHDHSHKTESTPTSPAQTSSSIPKYSPPVQVRPKTAPPPPQPIAPPAPPHQETAEQPDYPPDEVVSDDGYHDDFVEDEAHQNARQAAQENAKKKINPIPTPDGDDLRNEDQAKDPSLEESVPAELPPEE